MMLATIGLASDDATRPAAGRTWPGALARAALAWDAATTALTRRLAGRATIAVDEDEAVDLAGSSAAFAEALRDDSNLEVDWLWRATRVTRVQERRYCLRRALRINPASQIARRELKRLPPG